MGSDHNSGMGNHTLIRSRAIESVSSAMRILITLIPAPTPSTKLVQGLTVTPIGTTGKRVQGNLTR